MSEMAILTVTFGRGNTRASKITRSSINYQEKI